MVVRFTDPALARRATAQKRFRIFFACLCLGYFVVVGRAVELMLQDNKQLGKIAMRQYRAAIQQTTDRSRILDIQGKELAISVPAWSLYADPKEIKNVTESAQMLSAVLGMSKESLQEKLGEKRRFVWLKRRLDTATMEKIRGLNLEGIYSLKQNMRFYPHGDLGGVVLGAVGVDSQPLAGIEMAYDPYLMIQPKSGVYLKDARGQLYLTTSPPEEAKENGDVYLTLDKNIQFFAEDALTKAVHQHNAKAGIVLVMSPDSGDILAMANYPPFNPNQFDQAGLGAWRNRAVTDVFEPGSTFKVIVAAAALENHVVSLDEKFNCEQGMIEFGDGNIIHDHSHYDWLSLGDIIKVSSNIGIYKVSQRLQKKKLFETITDFGFGSKTNIDFPGEVAGIVRPFQKWRPIEEGTISFGQGIGVTPLQLLSAFSAIANGGVRMRPHLVAKVMGKDGEILYQKEQEIISQPISGETAKILTQILKGVVEKGGTAPLAYIDAYPVAGKTGTAQKVDPHHGGYLKDKYVASFVGFAPADHPRLVTLVLLDEPQGSYYGGLAAAPVFKEVMTKSLQYLGDPPQGKENPVWAAKTQSVLPQSMSQSSNITQEGNHFKIPDFHGVSLRQVLKAAGDFPIEVEFKGRGQATSQRPEAGTLITAGSKIYVEFQPLY